MAASGSAAVAGRAAATAVSSVAPGKAGAAAVKVAVEFNGKVHALVPGAWEADLERRGAVDDSSWRLLPVISSGIYGTPEQTLRRVHRVLLARGLPGVPLRLGDGWRAHFPGHADAA